MSITQLTGDARDMLATLPDDHFDCVVTSPPYWGLRDYGVAGQIGMESSLGEHIAVMVGVFRAVKRVLKPSGTCWVNYGDCYASAPNGRSAADAKLAGGDDRTFRDKPFSTVGGTLKPGDLCLVPERFAIAMQDDGWFVRSQIIWGKPNAMPDSSGRFRPSSAHEKIFLFTKANEGEDFCLARDDGSISRDPDHSEMVAAVTTGKPARRWIRLGHFYDAASVRIAPPLASNAAAPVKIKKPDSWNTALGKHGTFHPAGRERGGYVEKQRGHLRRHKGFDARWDKLTKEEQRANGRLLRNYEPPCAANPVWVMATAAFREAHYATFPPELVERCLAGGCPPGGKVLDPFGGAGTVALVADRRGLDCTLIELNPDNVKLSADRIRRESPLFASVEVVA